VELVADLQLLKHDDLHVALAYIDGFCTRIPVHGNPLLFAAMACLLVASKFMDTPQEDSHPLNPSFTKVLAALGNPDGITVKMLAAAECSVLPSTLKYPRLALHPLLRTP